MEVLDGEKHQFIFIDLEGTASVLVSRSIALADFVIVPVQASAVDVRQAGKAIPCRAGRGTRCAALKPAATDPI